MMDYRITQFGGVFRIADETFIPADPANTDYQVYLAWLEDGNEPEPAPVPEPAPELEPPVALTTEQKLEAAGLTVAELRELLNLPTPKN
jgi:hypothetical protein